LFLKTFSRLQPGEQGPHRFRPEDIRAIFAARFEVLDVVDTEFDGRAASEGALLDAGRR